MAMRSRPIADAMRRVLVLRRVFSVPAGVVFAAWTRPRDLVRWRGAPGYTAHSCTMDARAGGGFRFGLRSPDGSERWLQGSYLEVVEAERVVFTEAWEDAEGRPGYETLVTVTLIEQDEKTSLTLHQAVFESVTARDAHAEEWSSCLDCLAEQLTADAQG